MSQKAATAIVACCTNNSCRMGTHSNTLFSPAMVSPPGPAKGHFNVLYFAGASSFTGKDREALSAPLPLGKLFAELEARYPGMKAKVLDSCLVTVNLNYVDVPQGDDEGALIQEADEVAIIPPVSSG